MFQVQVTKEETGTTCSATKVPEFLLVLVKVPPWNITILHEVRASVFEGMNDILVIFLS